MTRAMIANIGALWLMSTLLILQVSLERLGTYWGMTDAIIPFLVLGGILTGVMWVLTRLGVSARQATVVTLFTAYMLFQYQGLVIDLGAYWPLVVIIGTCGAVGWLVLRDLKYATISFLVAVFIMLPVTFLYALSIGGRYIQTYDLAALPVKQVLLDRPSNINDAQKPDIYFIVHDAYAGPDTLRDLFGHDNDGIIDDLRQRGFYVADQSKSYYSQTMLSISSTLNLNYFQDDIKLPHTEFADRGPAVDYFLRPRLTRFLKQEGYQLEVISSGYDLDFSFNSDDLDIRDKEFQVRVGPTLINRSPLYPLLTMIFGGDRHFLNPYRDHYDLIVEQEDEFLTEIAEKSDKPRFFFVHFLLPHPPFVFNADGTFADYSYLMPFSYTDGKHNQFTELYDGGSWNTHYRHAYVEQLKYANRQMTEYVDGILAQKGDRPKIIMIQGDHGSRLEEDFSSLENSNESEIFDIMNAVYFSDGKYDALTRDISPVNVMRVMMNKYFGFDFKKLEDRQWFSTWRKPYEFQETHSTKAESEK